jgi:peptidoglycan/xylan/chitin deacetylase (PgdA/CDA1 family)
VTVRVGGDEWTRPLTDRRLVHDELYGLLKASGPAVRDDLVRQLVAWCPEAASAATRDSRPVVLEELRELASMPGVDIGAHSVHHLDLATVTREQLFQEVFECRSMLERAVERRVTGFAYPFGSLSPAAVGMARAAGYDYAVTCEARVLRPYEQAHRLPRLQVPAAEGTAFTEWLDSFGHEP